MPKSDAVSLATNSANTKISLLDRAFMGFESSSSPQTIGCALLLDKKPDSDALVSLLQSTVRETPRLRSTYKNNSWVICDEPIINFVRLKSEKPLYTAIGEAHERLDPSSNTWRVTELEYADGKFCLLVSWHHAWSDGLGGAALLRSLCKESGVAGLRASQIINSRPDLNIKFSELKRKSSGPRSAIHATFENSKIDRLKKERSLTSHQILLSLFIKSIFTKFADCQKLNVIQPISLRKNRLDAPLENRMIAATLSFKSALDDRLLNSQILRELKKCKESATIKGYELGVKIFGSLPLWLGRRFWQLALDRHLCICTSLGNLRNSLSVAGSTIIDILALPAPVFNQPFAFSWLSYQDKHTVTAVTDPAYEDVVRVILGEMQEILG